MGDTSVLIVDGNGDKADKLISMLNNVNPTLKFKSEMYELTFFDLVIYKGEILIFRKSENSTL